MIDKQMELLVETVRGVPGSKIEYMVMDSTYHRAGSRPMLGAGLGVGLGAGLRRLNYTSVIFNYLFIYLP